MRSRNTRVLAVVAAWAVLLGLGAAANEDPDYVARIESWRAQHEASLEEDSGWLTVAGLFWLREGENRVGASDGNEIVLPDGSAPDIVGVFDYEDGGTTSFRAAEGVTVTQYGEPVRTAILNRGEKHAIGIGDLTMWVHFSGRRPAIRLRDSSSPIREAFTGLKWFPVATKYKLRARFTPHTEPKSIEMLNVLGDSSTLESPGYVDFELDGKKIRVEPLSDHDDTLWLVFRDGTSGDESYAAARFLSIEAPANGEVILDFNRAYNPPCAYNPYTTCPVPTKQNRLGVRIEAGEMNYHTGS